MRKMLSTNFVLGMFLALPAHAEATRLFCENPHRDNSMEVEVDYQSAQVYWSAIYPGAPRLGPATGRSRSTT